MRVSDSRARESCSVGLTGVERRLGRNDLIVSKTDLAGRITYANRTFLEISGYTEQELLGKPHNIIRHPEMPRGVFKFLWDTISAGNEVFAYVINRCKSGDHYWVFAHVTPSFGPEGQITGYHSNRRSPLRSALPVIEAIYRPMLDVESRYQVPRDACRASLDLLTARLSGIGMTYDEYIFSISPIDQDDGSESHSVSNRDRRSLAGVAP